MLSVAVFLRTTARLAALSAVLACVLAMPALAGPDDEADPQTKLSQWLQRTRTKVQETADRMPPEWRKWLPKKQQAEPQYRGDGPDARLPGKAPDAGYHPEEPSQEGPHFPSLPDFGMRGGRITAAQLDRVEIGYQAGVLKIASSDGRVVYKRHKPGCELVAIDTVDYAPVDDENRREIFSALRISEGGLEATARGLIDDYGRLPHTKALAVLGVIASARGGLSEGGARRIRGFLSERLRAEKDVKVHRMAVLSLAVAAETDDGSVNAVLDLMDHSHNSWETFTCQQFFRYHRDEIRSRPSAWNVRRRLACTGNPYGPSLAADF